MTVSTFQRSFARTTPFSAHHNPSSSTTSRTNTRRPVRKTRLGRALLLQMLVSGSGPYPGFNSPPRRGDIFTPSAVVYEEEQSPSIRSALLNGTVDDWSNEPSSQDWDGRALDGGSQNLQAFAGLLAVTAAGFFCTRAVGTLFNHRSDLARVVPHPVSFSASSSTTAASPRSSFGDNQLRSRPLSPGSMDVVQTHDRGASPFPSEARLDRSTSMGSLTVLPAVHDSAQQTTDFDDDVSCTGSAALEIDAASTVSSTELSDMGSLDMRDIYTENRGLQPEAPHFRSLTPDMIKELPQELTLGTLRERAQLAMKAAAASTQAAQRAAAFSAAASTASASASKASNQAMAAASLAHIALESGNIELMTNAQAEAWTAVQSAAESEKRAAEAAALATAYEDLAEQNARVARELSRPPPMNIFQATAARISAFFHPVTAAIVGAFTAVTQYFVSVWTYFSSGTFWRQVCSFCSNSVAFVQAMLVSMFNGIKNACLNIYSSFIRFCSYVGNGMKQGFDSCMRLLKVLYTRIFNPRGPIGGEATA